MCGVLAGRGFSFFFSIICASSAPAFLFFEWVFLYGVISISALRRQGAWTRLAPCSPRAFSFLPVCASALSAAPFMRSERTRVRPDAHSGLLPGICIKLARNGAVLKEHSFCLRHNALFLAPQRSAHPCAFLCGDARHPCRASKLYP